MTSLYPYSNTFNINLGNNKLKATLMRSLRICRNNKDLSILTS